MFACQAPADAEFVWLGGQWDSLTPHEAAHNYTNQGPAFIRGAQGVVLRFLTFACRFTPISMVAQAQRSVRTHMQLLAVGPPP
eukprot:7023827-Prymnesium_polylepis.2